MHFILPTCHFSRHVLNLSFMPRRYIYQPLTWFRAWLSTFRSGRVRTRLQYPTARIRVSASVTFDWSSARHRWCRIHVWIISSLFTWQTDVLNIQRCWSEIFKICLEGKKPGSGVFTCITGSLWWRSALYPGSCWHAVPWRDRRKRPQRRVNRIWPVRACIRGI